MADKAIGRAENGMAVTEDMINEWSAAYDAGEIPPGYDTAETVIHGRPRLFNDGMESLTIRIPTAQKEALKREAAQKGIPVSVYEREILGERTNA